MESGIYVITNLINKHQYVGQSTNLKKRKAEHFSVTKEHNASLRRAFEKYGVENFSFEVLEYCEECFLNEKEIAYIASLKPVYNRTAGGRGVLGLHHSEHTKNLLRDKAKIQWDAKSEEEKKRTLTTQLVGPRIGHDVSPETREKLRAANLGKKQSAETIEKRKKTLANSEKYRLGRIAIQRPVRCIETGEVFDSVKAAQAKYGTSVGAQLGGRRKSCHGCHFEYLECRDYQR